MSFFHDVTERVVNYASHSGDIDFCATMEWRSDPKRWIQITGWYLNCSYPFAATPEHILGKLDLALPNTITLSEWKPNVFVTFEHGCESVSDIATLTREYASKALGLIEDQNEYFVKEEYI